MSATVRLVPVQEVYDDLLHRTLSRISCDLGRLIYLASTRDYNTGNYYHEGLATLAFPSGAGSDASLSLIATAVTCPTISASVPYLNFRTLQGDRGCGSSKSWSSRRSHQEQA